MAFTLALWSNRIFAVLNLLFLQAKSSGVLPWL